MNTLQKLLHKIDRLQQSHPALAFPYAVLKKYGEDKAGHQAALLTYFGFLSLFPLLIVFTGVTQLVLESNPELQARVSQTVTEYLPLVGEQLQAGIQSPAKTGLALALSLLITFYGARGVANALQYALSTLWRVPETEHPPLLKSVARSLGLILVAGTGLVLATVITGFMAFLGHGLLVRLLAALLGLAVLWATFIVVFKLAIAGNKTVSQVALSAAVTAIGITALQMVGTSLLAAQLDNLGSAYGTFALVLGILFWINLQAQVVLYAVEIDTVKYGRLWPRSLSEEPLTMQDERSYRTLARSQKQHKDESIAVSFRPKKSR